MCVGGTLDEVEGLSEKLSPEGCKGSHMEKLLVDRGRGHRRWDGTELQGGEQQGQGPEYILEAESHCGQSRVMLWSTDRREADFHEAEEWLLALRFA